MKHHSLKKFLPLFLLTGLVSTAACFAHTHSGDLASAPTPPPAATIKTETITVPASEYGNMSQKNSVAYVAPQITESSDESLPLYFAVDFDSKPSMDPNTKEGKFVLSNEDEVDQSSVLLFNEENQCFTIQSPGDVILKFVKTDTVPGHYGSWLPWSWVPESKKSTEVDVPVHVAAPAPVVVLPPIDNSGDTDNTSSSDSSNSSDSTSSSDTSSSDLPQS